MEFAVGQTVYFINTWKNFEGPDIFRCFAPLSVKEIKALKPDELVWVNLGEKAYHPSGGVQGFTCRQVKKVYVTDEVVGMMGMNIPEKVEVELQNPRDKTDRTAWQPGTLFKIIDTKLLEWLVGKYECARTLG